MQEPSPSRDRLVSRIPFFYGWMMVPVTMIVHICTSPGQTFGISAFNPSLREAFDLSQSELSGAYMLGTLLASLPMTYVGHLMDRYGPRRTLAWVALLFGCACLWMSQVSGLVTLFTAFLFLRMLGQGSMSLLASNSVALWFNKRLGTVSGIMSLGMAVGMGSIPAINLWLIGRFGWRWSYAILGLAVWVLVLPLMALLFRNRPEEVGQLTDGRKEEEDAPAEKGKDERRKEEPRFTLRQAMRTRPYWVMAGALAFASMSITGTHFHSVQVYLDKGMTATQAAGMFSVFAAAWAVMRFLGGVLADRLPLNGLLACAVGGMGVGYVLMIDLSTPLTGHLFAGALGGAEGVLTAVGATLWVRYYGRAHLGKIVGSLTTIGVASSSLGPFVMGAGHDFFGRYDESLWFFVALAVPLTLAALLATPPEVPAKRGSG